MRQRQTAPALQSALPDHGHAPSVRPELAADVCVARPVAADLVTPEVFAGLRPSEERAVMAVPETSMNKDRSPVLRQDQIGFARQLLCVEPVPETPRVQGLADNHLRARVSPPDRRHVAAAGCPVVNVSQRGGAAAF